MKHADLTKSDGIFRTGGEIESVLGSKNRESSCMRKSGPLGSLVEVREEDWGVPMKYRPGADCGGKDEKTWEMGEVQS